MEKRSTRPHAQARKRSDQPPRERSATRCSGAAKWSPVPSTVTHDGLFLIRVWLGTFGIVVVAALLRAAPEHDPTG